MAGRKTGSTNKNSKPRDKEPKPQKKCPTCEEDQVLGNFYMSESPLHFDKKIPYCKLCLRKIFDKDSDHEDSLKKILKLIDKPYFYHLYESAKLNSPENIFGEYMRLVIMPHNRGKGYTFESSIFNPTDTNIENNSLTMLSGVDKNKSITNIHKDEFYVTDEILEKWGEGYTSELYRLFERKYTRLIRNYGEKTELHTEGLITYIRFRVQEEISTAKGLVKDAKEWAALATKAAQDAKINVSQLSKSDISGGIDVLSQLFEAVESEASIIPLLPKLLEQPYDDADMIIWANINYYRTLEDKPRVPYRDIWNFYDDMLGEYFEQQGFNKKQSEDYKKKRNNVFRDLGELYTDPLYDGDGD